MSLAVFDCCCKDLNPRRLRPMKIVKDCAAPQIIAGLFGKRGADSFK
jgi:hypothetical protein